MEPEALLKKQELFDEMSKLEDSLKIEKEKYLLKRYQEVLPAVNNVLNFIKNTSDKHQTFLKAFLENGFKYNRFKPNDPDNFMVYSTLYYLFENVPVTTEEIVVFYGRFNPIFIRNKFLVANISYKKDINVICFKIPIGSKIIVSPNFNENNGEIILPSGTKFTLDLNGDHWKFATATFPEKITEIKLENIYSENLLNMCYLLHKIEEYPEKEFFDTEKYIDDFLEINNKEQEIPNETFKEKFNEFLKQNNIQTAMQLILESYDDFDEIFSSPYDIKYFLIDKFKSIVKQIAEENNIPEIDYDYLISKITFQE